MVSFNVGLFLLAMPAFLVQADSKLRGSPPESGIQRDLRSHGYNMRVGACFGKLCGVYGDPHVYTCDGARFDCQGLGTFNIMENHMWKVQGRFVDVGAHEHNIVHKWGFTQGASITNDLAIKFKPDSTVPVFQLGFGDLTRHDGTFPSEDGCTPYQYYNPSNMPGQEKSFVPTLQDCHDKCEGIEDCTKFSFWADGGCHMNSDAQTPRSSPKNWARSLSGDKEQCGLPPTNIELKNEAERFSAGMIGPRCPLLFHIDGALQDISGVGNNEFYYGDENSPVKIKNKNNKAISMQFTTSSGEIAEITILVRGDGPGELWSCHFDFWICLPASEQTLFMGGTSTGMMGTPDGDPINDFINAMGDRLRLNLNERDWRFRKAEWHRKVSDYCYENHCTLSGESIMTPPEGMTFEHIKCEHVDYVPFDIDSPSCVLTSTEIRSVCEHLPPLTRQSCEIDCCAGGYSEIHSVLQDIADATVLSNDENDINNEPILPPEPPCTETGMKGTVDNVCPSSDTDIVELRSISGTHSLPDGDVFFDIKMDSGDDDLGRTLKFKVNNPLDKKAEIYVKYGKSVFGHAFMDPKCEAFEGPVGCNVDAVEIEVACHDYENIAPFALIQVYFVSEAVSGTTDIDGCCGAPEYSDDKGVVMYSFEVQCACPANSLNVQ